MQGEDLIDVSAIDADVSLAGNQAFEFPGDATDFTAAGQILYFQDGSFTHVYLNNDADTDSESAFSMNGTIDLTALDFLL